jgi:hypothetical protein
MLVKSNILEKKSQLFYIKICIEHKARIPNIILTMINKDVIDN